MDRLLVAGDSRLSQSVRVRTPPMTVVVDAGTVSIYELFDGVRGSTVVAEVTPGSPKIIKGKGEFDIVRTVTTNNVYVDQ